ncbi:hypothetical protein V3C97_04010 [Ligilactobacillus saerimneri]|uniref:hypothetical protein n=1 Tax=Ligilactobacillus saerimneri TaxID=228229 RepID=UPI0030CF75A0
MTNYPAVIRFADISFDEQENLMIDRKKIREAMRKKNRPYAKVKGALIFDRDNTYFVPFRSHLNKQNYIKNPETYVVLEEDTFSDGTIKNLKRLELDKTIVVSDELNFKVSRSSIDRKTYQNLVKKQEELHNKLYQFIQNYKRYVIEGKVDEQFKYTTLKYFHKELGLPPIKKTKQNTKRKDVANLKGDSKRLDKKFVDKVINDYRQEKRKENSKSRGQGKQLSKRQRRR